MKITIHRGTKQIGGCVTEISTAKTRLFIDLGADLTKDKNDSKVYIDGLTTGNSENSVLLITHYHGDHIGRIEQALPGIPIYIGKTAKEISLVLSKCLKNTKRIEILEKAKEFEIGKEIPDIKDIKVTPFLMDHSAYDAYGFLIEAEEAEGNIRIFYTGDFRLHGFRGKKMLEKDFFEKYVQNIDYLICEGTNISRLGKAQTEEELQQEAMELFKDPNKKYVFILCSSTNIDRIFGFYYAYNKIFKWKRPFICDDYQEEVLKIIDPKYEHSEAKAKDGFCRLIRPNSKYEKRLEEHFLKHPDNSFIIYSTWEGYLNENNDKVKDDKLINFLKPYSGKYKTLHTSGHADIESLKKVMEKIKPKHIIPIHTENPDEFSKLFNNTILLDDGAGREL